MEHEHTPGQLKWNGGNPVFLCADEDCELVVWHAECVGAFESGRAWVPGARYGCFEEN